jgi:hypothetical protein
MGNNSSNESSISEQKLIDEANRKFNIRVKSYSYPHHGPYHEYIEWCRAQYELDCIPEYLRYGKNFNPKNHDHY